jgi:hypothetical protein
VKPRVITEPETWARELLSARAPQAPMSVLLLQAQAHWLTPASAALRQEIEDALGQLLFSGGELRVARAVLYDPPGVHVGEFAPLSGGDESEAHRTMTDSLRDWLRIIDMWGALFTERRYMRLDRPETERFQLKMWVIGQITDQAGAVAEFEALPADALVIAADGRSFADMYPASNGHGWDDPRLLWGNAPPGALDPTVGRRPAEVLSAGVGRFFSVDVRTERWWGSNE